MSISRMSVTYPRTYATHIVLLDRSSVYRNNPLIGTIVCGSIRCVGTARTSMRNTEQEILRGIDRASWAMVSGQNDGIASCWAGCLRDASVIAERIGLVGAAVVIAGCIEYGGSYTMWSSGGARRWTLALLVCVIVPCRDTLLPWWVHFTVWGLSCVQSSSHIVTNCGTIPAIRCHRGRDGPPPPN